MAHQVIGMVSQKFLLPEVNTVIRRDFSIKNLAEVALWADDVRKIREEDPWHYANIKEGEWTYVEERDCPDGECVIEKIHHFQEVLRDRTSPRKKRFEAIQYLVHFVGDVHQPLHLGNKTDRGGNRISLIFLGEPTNLHALWDSGLVALKGRTLVQYAELLYRRISEEDAEVWSRFTVTEWANESRKLALGQAYVPIRGRGAQLSKEYIERAGEIIDTRICQAAVRLANLLNQSLR